jgi:hypothetical protein
MRSLLQSPGLATSALAPVIDALGNHLPDGRLGIGGACEPTSGTSLGFRLDPRGGSSKSGQLFEKVTLTRVGILDIFCPCWNSIDVSYSGGGRQPNYPVRSSPLCVYTKTESVVFCPRCRTARSVPRSAR